MGQTLIKPSNLMGLKQTVVVVVVLEDVGLRGEMLIGLGHEYTHSLR